MNLEKNIGENNIDLNKYKWILGTGCSYGALVRSTFSPFDLLDHNEFQSIVDKNPLPEKLHITDDYVISINVPLSAHGAEWQSDSIIYLVDFLLNKGVLPENIYCSIEWSEWFRTEEHQSYLFDLDIKDFEFLKFTDCFHDVRITGSKYGTPEKITNKQILDILDEIKISTSEETGMSLGTIGGNVYTSVFNSDIDEVNRRRGFKYSNWLKELRKVNNNITTEKKIKRYLDIILKTQWFLKSKSINYDCLMMNNQFSNWFISNEGSKLHSITDSIFPDKLYNLEEIFPQFKHLLLQIDFNHFWFWKDRGGIDEWAMELFNESGYSGPININNIDYFSNISPEEMNIRIPHHGNHPTEIFYILLWNVVSKHCNFFKVKKEMEEWIWSLYNEDYNSDLPTINGLVLSKKFIKKYIKL